MWGTSFLFTKIALEQLQPVTVVTFRLGLGAVVLLAMLWWRDSPLPRGGRLWLHLLVLSALGNTLPFQLIAWGQQSIDSGLAAMLIAWMPLGVLVLAHFTVPGETMTAAKGAGLLLGLLGVAILVGPDALQRIGGDRVAILSQLALFAAAASYAVNAILARHLPPGDAAVHTAATVSLAALTMLPVGATDGIADLPHLTPRTAFALAWLGVASTALATVLYFRIIASAGPTFLSLINYLIPPIAIIAGALVLGERPAPNSLIALAVILIGIAVSQRATRT
jgi:drug/metabolite transporter (DMT)-like permease